MDVRKHPNPRAALKYNELAMGGIYLTNGTPAEQVVIALKSQLGDGANLVLFLTKTDLVVQNDYFGPDITFREVHAHIVVELP